MIDKKKQDETEELNPSNDQGSTEDVASNEAEEMNETEELKKKIEALEIEKEKNYQSYLRALADQENLKRRATKEKEEAIKYGLETFLKELLPVLDSIEKASQETQKTTDSESALKALQEGFDLISKKLLQSLENKGLKPIPATGKAYDPNLHQAIQTEKSTETKSPVVKEEFIKGYELNGRLLRASMVSVSLPEEEK